MVALLLAQPGLQVNRVTPEGWSALVAAADKGHHGLVRDLLSHTSTDVNIRDNQGRQAAGYADHMVHTTGRTVLMGLCGLLDHTRVIHELLCHPNIDLLATDGNGQTAERLACAHIKNILVVFR